MKPFYYTGNPSEDAERRIQHLAYAMGTGQTPRIAPIHSDEAMEACRRLALAGIGRPGKCEPQLCKPKIKVAGAGG